MKYICLGYYDEKKWETMSEGEQNSMMEDLSEMIRESERRRSTIGTEG